MHCSLLVGDISVAIFLWGEFFFTTCFRQIMFFCAKNNFSSHLATMAIGSANPDGSPIFDPNVAANSFNNFFTSVHKTLSAETNINKVNENPHHHHIHFRPMFSSTEGWAF